MLTLGEDDRVIVPTHFLFILVFKCVPNRTIEFGIHVSSLQPKSHSFEITHCSSKEAISLFSAKDNLHCIQK